MAVRGKLTYVDEPSRVGQRIREARARVGMSQRELSFPGCTAAYISRIEKGERVPSLQILREFARRLNVSEAFLARGETGADPNVRLTEIRVALRLNDFDVARDLADRLLKDASSDRERARASALLGEISYAEGDPATGIEVIERARLLDPELESLDPDTAEALGRSYARTGEYESAIAVFLRNYQRAQESEAILEQTRFGSLLANAHADSGSFPEAEAILGEVVALADDVRDPMVRARTLWTRSRVRSLQNDPDSAARYAEQAIETLEFTDHAYHAARGYQLLAHIELDRGNVDRAAELLARGAPLVEEAGRPFELISFRLEQARALLKVGKPEDAASLAMEVSLLLAEGRPIDSGRSYGLLGDIFLELGDEERAIEVYELAIDRFEGVNSRYLVDIYGRLAELFESRGRSDKALELLKQAMKLQQTAGRMLAQENPRHPR